MYLEEPLLQHGLSITYEVENLQCHEQTDFQHVIIGESKAYGRMLFLDGVVQSTQADEAIYHETLIHPLMVTHGHARRVLVGGAGEGACLRELLRHPSVEQIVAVDLDAQVIELCKQHLPSWHQGAFEDPRVELRIEDVQETLRRSKAAGERWDVIVLDITEPVEDGPAVDLFTVRFFDEVAAALADDGMIVLQSGEFDLADLDSVRTVCTTLRQSFAWVNVVHVMVPSFHCMWCFTLAAKRPMDIAPADLRARVGALIEANLGSKYGPLRYYDEPRHLALTTPPPMFAEVLERPGRVITGKDDARLITYSRERVDRARIEGYADE